MNLITQLCSDIRQQPQRGYFLSIVFEELKKTKYIFTDDRISVVSILNWCLMADVRHPSRSLDQSIFNYLVDWPLNGDNVATLTGIYLEKNKTRTLPGAGPEAQDKWIITIYNNDETLPSCPYNLDGFSSIINNPKNLLNKHLWINWSPFC